MKLRILLFAVVLALFTFPALAQDTSTSTVAFNGFGFSFPSSLASSVNISQFPGDPTTLEQPGGPEVRHTQFVLYNDAPAPESIFEGIGGIRVYSTANFADYPNSAQEFQNLQTLLAQRPDLAQYMSANLDTNANNLPFLPVVPAAQIIRARAHYVDSASFQGVAYVTVYRQDVSPFVGSEFMYTYQGISSDGSTYVSAILHLNTALFPAEIPADFDYDTFNQQFADYLTQSIATLNTATPEDFTPSPATLDALVQSFTLTGTQPQQPATALPPTVPPAPTIEPTVTNSDATLGGLAGVTWTLVSYGDPSSPTQAVTDIPVTLVFSETGASGSAGCNSYSGSFQYDATNISFSQMIRTLMACSDPLMAQEDAYLGALETASSFQINGNQLQITYDGGVLTFTAS